MRKAQRFALLSVLVLALSVGIASVALATHPGDSNGKTHENYYNGPLDGTVGWTQYFSCSGTCSDYYPAGWFYFHSTGAKQSHSAGDYSYSGQDNRTKYDSNEMNYNGAGPTDWGKLYRHERAHQLGWDHGEGTPSTNAAYYAKFYYCYC